MISQSDVKNTLLSTSCFVVLLIFAVRIGNATAQEISTRSLEPPPIAASNSKAIEILRVWAAPGSPQQLTLRSNWNDPAAWGLLLADVARHAARAYAEQGRDRKLAFERIIAALEAELTNPTDDPKKLNLQ